MTQRKPAATDCRRPLPPDKGQGTAGDSLSMHADVEVWEDCCSCEAEPYWLEAFADQPGTHAPDADKTDR